MNQQVKYVNIKDLVLWTENPRDPIDENASDQDIVNRALQDISLKWTLAKLASEMGDYYDFSELPTIVYHNDKPVVYDGNRRMILGKIKHKLVTVSGGVEINIPEIPIEIPCNVCIREIALKNVFRKHSDSGSWHPLERDIFLHKFMGERKSPFLVLEESTGLISKNPHLNKRFVKEEIFREDILTELGFEIKGNKLQSVHDDEQAFSILTDISDKVQRNEITTRNNRGKVFDVLSKSSQDLIDRNKSNKPKPTNVNFNVPVVDTEEPIAKKQRQTKRIQKKEPELFGGKLYLKTGDVSNLYRDISDLYEFFHKNKHLLSDSFPSLIRMSLRLLCESAAKDSKLGMDQYIKKHYPTAKKAIEQDTKTTLSNQNVTEGSIVQLLHTGAHNYQSANNMEQTMAISIMIGSIITISHGKEQ